MEGDDQMSGSSDGEEGFATPSAVLEKMTICWQNELCAPCLLPTQFELVEILLDQIAGMEEDIDQQTNKMQLRISLHRMELQRISYITSDYLRCRLQKIEKNPNSAIEEHRKRVEEDEAHLLSTNELQFAQEYATLEAEFYSNTALETLRIGLQKLAQPEVDLRADMVYAKVIEDETGSVAIPDWSDLNAEVILEMEQFSVHLIPFNAVKHHVEKGSMMLM